MWSLPTQLFTNCGVNGQQFMAFANYQLLANFITHVTTPILNHHIDIRFFNHMHIPVIIMPLVHTATGKM